MHSNLFSRFAASLLAASCTLLAAGCANRAEAPVVQLISAKILERASDRLALLLPADVLLLGEQHDAAAHQQLEQEVITVLAGRGQLAAVALEMADSGVSTATLHPTSTEQQAQSALKWNNNEWPWDSYGPAVMTAVRAGIPVLGANLPRASMRDSMTDSKLDTELPGPALKAQQQLIRLGHCNLLPESQITPMTRIQIAKDITMANTLSQAVLPGKVVVLLSGNGHADRKLGVPQHLRSDLKVKAVGLRAGGVEGTDSSGSFDAIWVTPALPDKDYCAGLEEQLAPRRTPTTPAKP